MKSKKTVLLLICLVCLLLIGIATFYVKSINSRKIVPPTTQQILDYEKGMNTLPIEQK